ncbi:MAG: hypothetical protein COA73_16405 [Candidatus Hydrogenedentota bacterium]|nr:MAG: hypothetical protein COA73_16405 [Candidatus Hydrogenedentota bacterium]
MKIMSSLVLCGLLAGCATTGSPASGSKGWYNIRTQEIEGAYEYGEITKEQYLELKNEVDQIRVDYRTRSQSQLYYGSRVGFHPSYRYTHRSHHRHRRH